MDFDRAANSDLVFQPAIRLQNGGHERPGSIDLDFFENVDARGLTVRGVPLHGCCCLLRSPFGQIPRITDTRTDTKAAMLFKTKSLAERVGFEFS